VPDPLYWIRGGERGAPGRKFHRTAGRATRRWSWRFVRWSVTCG